MKTPDRLLVFVLEGHRYGVDLQYAERVIRAVDVLPLPEAPDVVLGVINVQGRIVPAIALRRRFRLPERDLLPTDHFIIVHLARLSVALVVDEVSSIIACPVDQVASPGEFTAGVEPVQGAVKLEDGLVLIYDLDKCLSLYEARALEEAMTS